MLDKMPVFNYEGSDKLKDRGLINAKPTGISNGNDVKYPWSREFYEEYQNNIWFPETVSLMSDKSTLENLTPVEMNALKKTLSFLIFLDSYQGVGLPSIADYITEPSVRDALCLQATQEVIHSKSYQYVLDSLFPYMNRDEIYNAWKDDPVLLGHINWVADFAKSFRDSPDETNFKRVIAATYALESLFFYHGFAFFYHLSFRKLLVNTSEVIQYIENDELTHVKLFSNIIRELFDKQDYEMLQGVMLDAVQHEIDRACDVYGDDKIPGISHQTIEQYVKFLYNQRAELVGLQHRFENVENPYVFIGGAKRKDFFSGKVVDYDKGNSLRGWDDLMK